MKETIKKAADLIRTAGGVNRKKYKTSAVIAAAGMSSRMVDGSKQFLEIHGIPVIAHTLKAFEKCDVIDEIIIAARSDEVGLYEEISKKYKIDKLAAVVEGGETRQESVRLAFDKISQGADFVAIHDAARCMITPKMIEDVTAAAYKYGAAAAASQARDTIKYADKNRFITETPPRENLWLAQTPQIFGTTLYRAAAYSALEAGYDATDDCMLVERLGFRVKLVDCGFINMKITFPADVEFVRKLMSDNDK